jgi:hypothetical protein
MRSQPDGMRSNESTNAWGSTSARNRWLLATLVPAAMDGVLCG